MSSQVGSADIYITPYCHEAQAVSGTLAYAMGAGKAIISTPYWYAAELLADGRGTLVPFENPEAITAAAIELLDNDAARQAMRSRAYTFGRAGVSRMQPAHLRFPVRAAEKNAVMQVVNA
jgi:glycosyltransferase involved in cell wall biosynthesis